MISSLYVEIRKNICSKSFLWGILFVFALCMSTVAYTDSSTGKVYTVLEVLSKYRSEIVENLNASEIARNGLSSQYSALFLPIASGLTFVPQLCNERRSGYLRMQIIRQGKLSYALGKIISAFLCSGLIIIIGFMMYSIFVMKVFQSNSADYIKEVSYEISYWHIIAGKFTEGILAATLPLLLCTWMNDPYLILCIPVLYYFLIHTVHSLTINHFSAYGILNYLPLSGAALLWGQFSWGGFIVVAGLPLLVAIVFTLNICRKEDCSA